MEGSEEKQVRKCLQGDPNAWENIVRAYSGNILNMAYRYTGNYSVSEELTQEVFFKVYQNLSSFRSTSGTFRNWMMRVGRNLIIDHYRAHKKERHVAGTEELEALDFHERSGMPTPDEALQAKRKAERIYRGLETLSFELREAVVLRDIEGYSYREMAEMLEIPEGTVKSRINRGRIELAKALTGKEPR